MSFKNNEAYKKLKAELKRDVEREPKRKSSFRKPLAFALRKCREYSKFLDLKPIEVLERMEEQRNYWFVNYYQESNFPKLDDKNIVVIKNIEEFKQRFPSHKYRCPACGSITTDCYECNSGKKMTGTKKVCDWKSYGLFTSGFKVVCKEPFAVENIFRPIELEVAK